MGDQIDEEFTRADKILADTLKTFRDEGVHPGVYAAALLQVGVFSMLMVGEDGDEVVRFVRKLIQKRDQGQQA
ncbi:MAG: hypothetical protein IIB63_11490 [Proteobacteria bacterium]|nr:hypothetical protein [Pseudomonadota bacterium]